MNLFTGIDDTGEEGDTTATATQIAQLKMHGYNPDIVRKWSKEKAEAALGRVRRDAKATARRAGSLALLADTDEAAPKPGPSALERAAAALFVVEALAAGGEQVYAAVTGCAYALTEDELRALAECMLQYLTPAPCVGAGE